MLHNIDLDIMGGDVIGIIGCYQNETGLTTLIKAFSKHVTISGGSINYYGNSIGYYLSELKLEDNLTI